jgi:hypothetical protein
MSVQFDSSRSRWVVRWYDAGRQRSRRFQDEHAARAFEPTAYRRRWRNARPPRRHSPTKSSGFARAWIMSSGDRRPRRDQAASTPYATRDGVRWSIAVTRPDGTMTTRRGFTTHAAACQARDRLAHTPPAGPDMSFGRFWREWLAAKQPHVTEGALEDLDAHGRKRLHPHLAQLSIGGLTEQVSPDVTVSVPATRAPFPPRPASDTVPPSPPTELATLRPGRFPNDRAPGTRCDTAQSQVPATRWTRRQARPGRKPGAN